MSAKAPFIAILMCVLGTELLVTMSMASLSNWGFNFLVVFAFPLMLAGPGLAFTFTVFAVICLGGIAFTLLRVPETTGHSLEAIEKHLLSGEPLAALRRVPA